MINLSGFLQALEKIGYSDSLSVEVFGRGLKEMPRPRALSCAWTMDARLSRKRVFPRVKPAVDRNQNPECHAQHRQRGWFGYARRRWRKGLKLDIVE